MIKKYIKQIIRFVISLLLLLIIGIIILYQMDPLLKYEKAWKEKDRSFFINKISELINEKDTVEFLNTMSRISDVSNCYFITPNEFGYEILQIKDFNIYKENIIFGLSSFVFDKNFFKGSKLFLSKCRKYDSELTVQEKSEILQTIEKH